MSKLQRINGNIWRILSPQEARYILDTDPQKELCVVYSGDGESVIESGEQIDEAEKENQTIGIFRDF